MTCLDCGKPADGLDPMDDAWRCGPCQKTANAQRVGSGSVTVPFEPDTTIRENADGAWWVENAWEHTWNGVTVRTIVRQHFQPAVDEPVDIAQIIADELEGKVIA